MIFRRFITERTLYFFLIVFFLQISTAYSQSDEDCFMCHEDHELISEKNGIKRSMFVDGNLLKKSVHKSVACASCHKDAAV